MTPATLGHEIYSSFMATMILCVPFLLVAVGIGLILAIVQAVTQIQDQALPQTVKIIVVSLMALGFSTLLGTPLYEETLRLFVGFPVMVR